MNKIEKLHILQVNEQDKSETDDTVVREFSLTIILNNHELATLLCSPTNLEYLAIGFLSSEGLLKSKDEIAKITVEESKGIVQVGTRGGKEAASEPLPMPIIGSGGGRGLHRYGADANTSYAKIHSQTKISAHEVFTLVKEFIHRSEVFKATGGVHSAALCNTQDILVFNEDIGRHNAIDKVFGQCILEDIPPDDRIIITSGRVSSEILLKVARRNIPILISKSAPTNLGVRLADDLGITLIGFVRGRKMNLYANSWRVDLAEHG